MFLFDVLHLLNEFHVFTSPIKTFISMGVIFILSEVLCWHVAWSVKCICLFQPSRNSIKTLRTSNETTKLWWNRYYIYFVNKNSKESDSTYPPSPLTPQQKKFLCRFGWIGTMKKINKFGVITRPSTYIGCNNITTFFFWPPPLVFR